MKSNPSTNKEDTVVADVEPVTSVLYLNFPSFIKRKQLQDHIKKHGFGDNIVDIDMHTHLPSQKPAGSAKALLSPSSLMESFICSLDGSLVQGKYRLSVQPYRQQKGWQQSKERSKFDPLQRETSSTTQKEPCVVFVGSRLPNYINKGHIQKHFAEYKDVITNIEFKAEKQKKGCFVLITLKSQSSAMKAVKKYNHTFLLGKHRIKVELYKPLSNPSSCPVMHTHNTTDSEGENQAFSRNLAQCTKAAQPHQSEINLPLKDVGPLTELRSMDMSYYVENTDSTHSLMALHTVVPPPDGQVVSAVMDESNIVYNSMISGENQLQSSSTTVIVENLDPKFTQNDIESFCGIRVDGYTPSHMTPDKVAAWIEVANAEYASAVANKLNEQVIHGKQLYCYLTPSSALPQQTQKPTSVNPEEQWSMSESIPLTSAAQMKRKPYFFLGDDKDESQGSQTTFSQETSGSVSYLPVPYQQAEVFGGVSFLPVHHQPHDTSSGVSFPPVHHQQSKTSRVVSFVPDHHQRPETPSGVPFLPVHQQQPETPGGVPFLPVHQQQPETCSGIPFLPVHQQQPETPGGVPFLPVHHQPHETSSGVSFPSVYHQQSETSGGVSYVMPVFHPQFETPGGVSFLPVDSQQPIVPL